MYTSQVSLYYAINTGMHVTVDTLYTYADPWVAQYTLIFGWHLLMMRGWHYTRTCLGVTVHILYMWVSQYTYIRTYVGVTVHIYMWASRYTYIRTYMGVTVHIYMWASRYTYEMRGRHNTHRCMGSMVHTYTHMHIHM